MTTHNSIFSQNTHQKNKKNWQTKADRIPYQQTWLAEVLKQKENNTTQTGKHFDLPKRMKNAGSVK